ncbi:MAG: hypothetical protein DYH15_02260 [Nitrosomonas sp. PRO4]|nr:hypothetical protein [Nitrosomonas sp. PRO4]
MNSDSHSQDADKLNKSLTDYSTSSFSLLLVIFFIALLFHSDLAPLEETHWDAPIYVELSKRAAATHVLADYHQHAQDIRLGPGDDVHWYFTRIGHILLLGEITKLFGATESALYVMLWLYRVLTALSVMLCVIAGLHLVKQFRTTQPDCVWWIGYVVAALTYIVSDGYRGLQGHLISEPPAFLALMVFTLISLKAVELRSIKLGIISGCLLFLLFFIRIDAVLPGIFFLSLLLFAKIILKRFDTVPSIIIAGMISFICYLIYAWWFYPLVNPQTLADFSSVATEMFSGVPVRGLFAIAIAGGLLWVGASVAIATSWRDPVVRFAILWLGLALLPLMIDSFTGRTLQARMAFIIVPPLMILSGEGWTWLLRNFQTHRKIRPLAISLFIVLILAVTPSSIVMRDFRNWAVNHLPNEAQKYLFLSLIRSGTIGPILEEENPRRGILVRPMYERWTLEYPKVIKLLNYLNSSPQPAYLLWSTGRFTGQHSLQNYIRLFHYFGKEYQQDSNFIETRFQSKFDTEPCSARTPTKLQPIIYCTVLDKQDLEILQRNKTSLYILGVDEYPMPQMPELKLTPLLAIPPFTLYEIAE